MADDFQHLRFVIFCKLAGESVGRVADFAQEVEEEQTMQQEIQAASSSGEEKRMTPLYSGVNRLVVGSTSRFIIKVWYDEHHYKSIIISPNTTAKQVRALACSTALTSPAGRAIDGSLARLVAAAGVAVAAAARQLCAVGAKKLGLSAWSFVVAAKKGDCTHSENAAHSLYRIEAPRAGCPRLQRNATQRSSCCLTTRSRRP